MIYNAVSAKSIIGKVYRDYGIEDPSFELDAIEWMGEALDWIGAGIQSIDKEAFIVATNHTATLPSDLEVLKGVWVVNNAPLKNNWRQKEFPYDLSKVEDLQKYKIERSDEQLHEGIGGPETDLQEGGRNRGDELQTIWQELQGDPGDDDVKRSNEIGYNNQENYHLNGNELKTTFNSGLILVAYKGLPLDDDGYPLIPDDVAYKDGLAWYIVKKLALRSPNKFPFDHNFAEQKWLKRCTQARNRAKFPDLDEYEKFLQSWTKMVETERFNKGSLFGDLQDKRGDLIESGQFTPGQDGNFRVTESGVTRITEGGDTRFTEDN